MWLLASFNNALLCSAYISVSGQYPGELPEGTVLIFFSSLFFSAPGFFIFWAVLLIKLGGNMYGRDLFRVALATGFTLAATTAIICSQLLKSLFPANRYVLILFAILSAIASIMMHFNYFKKINNQVQ
jgi:hypothetical protein